MAISEVLAEAIADIEHYQRELPDAYNELKQEIEYVKHSMQWLKDYLDDPTGNVSRPPALSGEERDGKA